MSYHAFRNTGWVLYDNTSAQIILQHHLAEVVKCPFCGLFLVFKDHKAECCGETFKTGFGCVRMVRPYGKVGDRHNCGWKTVRPYNPNRRPHAR